MVGRFIHDFTQELEVSFAGAVHGIFAMVFVGLDVVQDVCIGRVRLREIIS